MVKIPNLRANFNMLSGMMLIFTNELLILSNFKFRSIISAIVTTSIKYTEKLQIRYYKYGDLKVLMKIEIRSFSNRKGLIHIVIPCHFKTCSLIDSLFIFSILWRSNLFGVIFILNLYWRINASNRSLNFLIFFPLRLIY